MAIERYIGAKQICERLSVSRSRAYEIMAELPRLKAGGSVRVSESSLARWVELRTVQPTAPYVPPRKIPKAEFWRRVRAPAMGDGSTIRRMAPRT